MVVVVAVIAIIFAGRCGGGGCRHCSSQWAVEAGMVVVTVGVAKW